MNGYEPLWSPYVAGGVIGLLNLFALYISDNPLAASTSYLKISGLIRKMVQGDKVLKNPYYKKKTPEIDWGVMLIIGIVFGSFFSAVLSGTFAFQFIPSLWESQFSSQWLPRFIIAVIGGMFIGVGSRWAGGCTSGHGISGVSQLSLTSMIAAASFFIGGIITAFLVYGL